MISTPFDAPKMFPFRALPLCKFRSQLPPALPQASAACGKPSARIDSARPMPHVPWLSSNEIPSMAPWLGFPFQASRLSTEAAEHEEELMPRRGLRHQPLQAPQHVVSRRRQRHLLGEKKHWRTPKEDSCWTKPWNCRQVGQKVAPACEGSSTNSCMSCSVMPHLKAFMSLIQIAGVSLRLEPFRMVFQREVDWTFQPC